MDSIRRLRLLEAVIDAVQQFLERVARAHPWLRSYEESLVRFFFEAIFSLSPARGA